MSPEAAIAAGAVALAALAGAWSVTGLAPALPTRPGVERLARALGYLALGLLLERLLPFAEASATLAASATVLVIAAAETDLRAMVLPDLTSAGLAAVGLAFAALPGDPGLLYRLVGCALGAGMLAGAAWWSKRRSGVDGVGLGDIKLAAALGLLLGPELLPIAVAVAALGSLAVVGLIRLAPAGRLPQVEGRDALPFGAPLALSGAAALIGGAALGVP
jgi:prepilin signal peptidase PulO-like enzyme (type II secretory pathway)